MLNITNIVFRPYYYLTIFAVLGFVINTVVNIQSFTKLLSLISFPFDVVAVSHATGSALRRPMTCKYERLTVLDTHKQ